MKKPITPPQLYFTSCKFRKLSLEQVGEIQHRIIDLNESANDLAREFNVSNSYIYRAKNAVPIELIQVDDLGLQRLRERAKKRRRAS